MYGLREFQRDTSQHDTPVVHTKGISKTGGWGDKKTYLCIKVTYSPFSLKSQRRTSQHDTQAVHTKKTTFLLKIPNSCQKYPILAKNTQFLKEK